MNCEDAKELLGAWLDGELIRADAEAVRTHLDRCAECREQTRQLEKLDALMKSALAPSASGIAFAPFWHGVRERIQARRPWSATVIERVRSALTGPSLAWAVPAVIVLLIGVVSLDSLWRGRLRNNLVAVESIDAHGRNVALLREDDSKTTVIWLYQDEDNESKEPASGPTF